MSFVIFLLTLGAALRLTRLAVDDTITRPFRDLLAARYSDALTAHAQLDPESPDRTRRKRLSRRAGRLLFFVQLFECPWCIGFWISSACAAVALSPAISWIPVQVVALGLSISYLVGLIYTAVFTLEEFEPNNH